MSCERCGVPCQGRRCRSCEQIDRCEARHGDRVERDRDAWAVTQTGLGDQRASGQATLDGGIVPEGGDE